MGAVIRIDILGDSQSAQRSARDAGRGYDRLGRSADGSSRRVRGLGSALGAAAKRYGPLAAAATAYGILKIGKDSIEAASRVQQAFGAIDAVFGKNSKVVKQWAARAANDVGLAKSEYGQLAVVLGSMLKNNGMKEFASQTQDLIFKGADLAAQFGGSTKDAIEAISSLLRGERDPIERYGVSIKDADIKARLAADGLDKLTGSAKKAATQQAVLKLLNEQTSSSYKAFSRESGTLANSQQILGARWENLKATLGERLLPVATRVVTWLSDTIEGSNDTGKGIRKLGEILDGFFSPILEGLREGWKSFNDAVNDASDSSTGVRDIIVKVGKAAEKYGPMVGSTLGTGLAVVGQFAGYAAAGIGTVVSGIKTLKRWAELALAPLQSVIDALGKIPGVPGGGGGGAGRGAGVAGGRGGVALERGGLGRAYGMGAFGYGGGGGSITVSAAPVQIFIDGAALASGYYTVGRQAARDEISTQVRTARGTGR